MNLPKWNQLPPHIQSMHDENRLTFSELSKALGVSAQAIRAAYTKGEFPRPCVLVGQVIKTRPRTRDFYVSVSKHTLFRIKNIRKHLLEQERDSTNDIPARYP